MNALSNQVLILAEPWQTCLPAPCILRFKIMRQVRSNWILYITWWNNQSLLSIPSLLFLWFQCLLTHLILSLSSHSVESNLNVLIDGWGNPQDNCNWYMDVKDSPKAAPEELATGATSASSHICIYSDRMWCLQMKLDENIWVIHKEVPHSMFTLPLKYWSCMWQSWEPRLPWDMWLLQPK